MDENHLIERMRADADQLDTTGSDVETLVSGAVQQGRRRRTHRRIAGGVAGLVAASLLVAVPVSTALRDGTTALPVGVPQTSATKSPAPTPDDRVSGSPDQVGSTLIDVLPGSLTVTEVSVSRDENANGFAWENSAHLTVTDEEGTSYISAGIGDDHYTDYCFGYSDCTTTEVPGPGSLEVTSSTPGDENGEGASFLYNRPDGGHIWLIQRTYVLGNGPVTRDALPLTEATGREIVTDPTWDELFTQ